MPPVGYRKRHRSPSPVSSPPPKRKAAAIAPPKKSKPTIFDTADAPGKKQNSVEENKRLLEEQEDDDEDDSSLSDADSDEFEDVPPAKRRKTAAAKEDVVENDEDDEMDWEDAIPPASPSQVTAGASRTEDDIGDVSISVNEDGSYIEPLVSAGASKKGPSKRERQIRVQTHCLHVMSLMWHNTIRNSWLNDKEVQKTLVDGLPEGVKKEVRRWKEATRALNGGTSQVKTEKTAPKIRGKRGAKGTKSSGRDWNSAAESHEVGTVHATNALLRLLKVMTAYWRKRFAVTSPGLRKQGYKDLRRLRNEIKAWEKDRKDFEQHGERVESKDELCKLAKKCEGSRDVGAQLFVALLRGLGLETRMVANLQPAGFGWSKAEEANPSKAAKKDDEPVTVDSESEPEVKVTSTKGRSNEGLSKTDSNLKKEKPTRKSSRGNKGDPIDLDESDSSLSEAPSETEDAQGPDDDDDDLSVVDVTPSIPKRKPHKKYDRDLAFPSYWTEVCDPVSNKYYPVDPIVLSTIASSDELLQTFEPRGKKAEKSKQVICYTIAFAADGTAKDVTVRYLKRHQLPGKTKGMRMPVEKVPIYNRKGKVRRYEEYDWFRTLTSLYDRPETKRTAADDQEEQTDLKPFKPAKEEKQVDKESLQGYKQSADFVLEQHLRREEALKPGAKPVKSFTAGKGDKVVEHPVYRRSDVLFCRTVESWHKEGRAIKVGEQPIKYVPMRAVTLIRKREMEDAQRETGEKLKQGLYSESQTDWIIPPPIEDGVIPKNAFGNMDVYVPTMVPQGAVHLPLKGTAKLCRKLQVDYAEACTGFEFGKQRAVPVLTGVVVAKGNEHLVRDAWQAEQVELKRKEDTKRTAAALHWWRKMLLGLRVLERMRTEYADSGGKEEEMNPFVLKAKREGRVSEANGSMAAGEEDVEMGGGGFFPEGHDEEEVPQRKAHARHESPDDGGGGFLMDESDHDVEEGGVLLLEDDPKIEVENGPSKDPTPITPVSLQSMHKSTDGAADSEPDESNEPIRQAPKATAATGRKQSQPKQSVKSKKSRRIVESDDDEFSLAEPSDSINDDGESEQEGDGDPSEALDAVVTPRLTSKKAARKAASPQVVITRQKEATPSSVRKRSSRAAKKSTPVRSQYFDHSEEDESDNEVVKPRKTTARTRSRA
ncbi:hypothetical protein LTR37_021421 [Vermiconidia calcicola]|uniref:Uncharacterized protein n=1 Tax=Vermiconidia calcicola TaxID=1690605 RepID=A0ACC3M8M1_9PEZI|nr:hypothetical protein LTR37_021421 [Vermiconidia calcicola]